MIQALIIQTSSTVVDPSDTHEIASWTAEAAIELIKSTYEGWDPEQLMLEGDEPNLAATVTVIGNNLITAALDSLHSEMVMIVRG